MGIPFVRRVRVVFCGLAKPHRPLFAMAKFAFLLWAACTVQAALSAFNCSKYGQSEALDAACPDGECEAAICCDLTAKTCGRFKEVDGLTCAEGETYKEASTALEDSSGFSATCCSSAAGTADNATTTAATTTTTTSAAGSGNASSNTTTTAASGGNASSNTTTSAASSGNASSNTTTTSSTTAAATTTDAGVTCRSYTAGNDAVDTVDNDAAVESGRTFVLGAAVLFFILQY